MGLNIKKSFATDPKLEADGVWMEVGDGASLLIARTGNPKHSELVARHVRPIARRIEKGLVPKEKTRKLLAKIYARSILLGWKGIEDETGAEIPYSAAKAEELLHDLPDFFDLVQSLADDRAAFRAEEIEEDAKHLGEGSGGKSSGSVSSPTPEAGPGSSPE